MFTVQVLSRHSLSEPETLLPEFLFVEKHACKENHFKAMLAVS